MKFKIEQEIENRKKFVRFVLFCFIFKNIEIGF